MSVILVLDTNVVIDATFHRNQYSQRVLDALYKGNIQLATSDTISYEVMGVVMHHAITAGLSISQAKNHCPSFL